MLGDGVGDGQLVQVELSLQGMQQLAVGVAQADPDHVPGPGGPLVALLDVDIGDFPPLMIDSGGNDLTHGCSSFAVVGAAYRSHSPVGLILLQKRAATPLRIGLCTPAQRRSVAPVRSLPDQAVLRHRSSGRVHACHASQG
ncbi:hypothetical protein D3C78_1298000 [compost metagenome]